jgi:predicted Zn-dependent protease
VTFHRREVLGTFGITSAATLLWAFGCGARPPPPARRAPQISRDVRSWLHDAVARLSALYPSVHALAVSRGRTTAAIDVLGPAVARLRSDGVVFTVRRGNGPTREHVTTELTAAGIEAALQALGASQQRATLDFGPTPSTPDEPPTVDDRDLRRRVEALLEPDARLSSRIVYAAALIDIDDAILWSVAPGRDLEQRLVRIRQSVTRAAWNGNRLAVADVEHAWSGGLDDQPLRPADITAASEAALKLMTPGSFRDDERTVLLDPSVAAIVLDAAARHLLTTTAASNPDLARRTAPGAQLASSLVTLIDDPTTAGAYGRFAFDDEGEPAAPLTLLDAGRTAALLSDRAGGASGRGRRPGHLGRVEPSSSHLVLVPGTADAPEIYTDGLALEGGQRATYDPSSDRIRIACARARELRAGSTTGRIYADVELVGSLTALLTAIDAIAREPQSFAVHDDAPGEPASSSVHVPCPSSRWRSIATPALRTHGFVRARRTRS